MPITLLSRRRFLGTLATSVGVLTGQPLQAKDANPHRVALLSDPHIGETATDVSRDCNMADRLKHVAREVTKLDPKPACAVINGDLALKGGTSGMYKQFAMLIESVREAGIPLHLGLGNHDHFGRFSEGLASLRPKDKPVDGEQVLVVELERVNLFVLDSYDPNNPVGGVLGAVQLKWLTAALDVRKDKPAVVLAHHPLQFDSPKAGKSNGIADTKDLWPILKNRSQVKAFIFGHTHTWKLTERDGVHLVNLPAIGYPFAKGEVTGWVDARFAADGVRLEVRAIDPKHANHGKTAELSWRKA
jgi:3',5'-cyclic AMP phosphodiesterase CpdA